MAHLIRLTLEGPITTEKIRTVSDDEALPLFIKLMAVLLPDEAPSTRSRTRRSRGPKVPLLSATPPDDPPSETT